LTNPVPTLSWLRLSITFNTC
jgi:Xaa-Pro aminopeptidase